MSTTTRLAYRPTYGPEAGTVRTGVTVRCGCGQDVTDDELFSHDCADDPRYHGGSRPTPVATTNPGDSLDVPEWQGGAPGIARKTKAPEVPNRFPGTCAACGTRVLPDAGIARKAGTGWSTFCARCAHDTNGTTIAPAPQPAPAPQANCRPNRFPGPCRYCGGHVPAGDGLLCRVDDAWAVEHKPGACNPTDGHTAAPEATPVPSADVAPGHYAIPSTGDNDLAFYRVDRPTEGDYAGRTFVKLVVGGHPDRNVRRDAVAGILARIAADPDAGARYGQTIGRCCRCNRTLTDDTSRAAGIGPECAKAT